MIYTLSPVLNLTAIVILNTYFLLPDTYQEVHHIFVDENNSNTTDFHLEFYVNSFHVLKVSTRCCLIEDNNLWKITLGRVKEQDINCLATLATLTLRYCLTNNNGDVNIYDYCSGEYRPEGVAVPTERGSTVRLMQARCKGFITWHSGHACLLNLTAFENKKKRPCSHVHRNGLYDKILTKKETITAFGFS